MPDDTPDRRQPQRPEVLFVGGAAMPDDTPDIPAFVHRQPEGDGCARAEDPILRALQDMLAAAREEMHGHRTHADRSASDALALRAVAAILSPDTALTERLLTAAAEADDDARHSHLHASVNEQRGLDLRAALALWTATRGEVRF